MYTMVHKSWNVYYEVGIVGMLQLQNTVDIYYLKLNRILQGKLNYIITV